MINLDRLSDEDRIELDQLLGELVWLPHPDNRPQWQAYSSPAFETLYGGAAGGGKSDLILGLARTMHGRSLLLRRSFPDLERSLISRSLEFYGESAYYNSTKHVWNIDGRRIEFGHMETVGTPQTPKDEAQYASAQYDFIGFDQLEQFPQYAYEFMLSRARSVSRKRIRMMATANPVGEFIDWIMQRWRAWLIDETAKPGELLYYKRDEFGNDIQTTEDDHDAVSRTYIPAGLSDNPYLTDGYRRILNSLPEPLRSALLKGNWKASLVDDAYQVMPRAWVRAAMQRWTEKIPDSEKDKPLVIGDDMARGGDDSMVLAPRKGYWFDKLKRYPGREITSGAKATKPLIDFLLLNGDKVTDKNIEYKDDNLILPIIESRVVVNIDVIGIGASAYDTARVHGINARPINFSEGSDTTDETGTLQFVNKRAECHWKFREALDPTKNSKVMLPNDSELEADLCSARWIPQSNGIKIEDKKEIKKRLGRSPDSGESVILSWADTPIQIF